MAQEHLNSAVANQKLAFARVALQAAETADGDSIQGKLARHAHLDAAVCQLCDALRYFLGEIAEEYGVELDPGRFSAQGVLQAFADSGKRSAQISEIQTLARREDSWLEELLATRAEPLRLAQNPRPREAANEGLIPLANLSEQDLQRKPPLERVREWSRELQSVVDRQRAAMHEE